LQLTTLAWDGGERGRRSHTKWHPATAILNPQLTDAILADVGRIIIDLFTETRDVGAAPVAELSLEVALLNIITGRGCGDCRRMDHRMIGHKAEHQWAFQRTQGS
jgi:hypothetical protein